MSLFLDCKMPLLPLNKADVSGNSAVFIFLWLTLLKNVCKVLVIAFRVEILSTFVFLDDY